MQTHTTACQLVSSLPATADKAPTLPDIPDHVPDKFKAVWASLPGCCRNFYLNPGKGCCAGMVEPNPGLMTEPAQPRTAPGTQSGNTVKSVEAVTSAQKATTGKGWLWATKDWSAYLVKGFVADMKRVMTGSKQG
jgi:hypothetical protein